MFGAGSDLRGRKTLEILRNYESLGGITQCTSVPHQWTGDYYCFQGSQDQFSVIDEIRFVAYNPITMIFRNVTIPPVEAYSNHLVLLMDNRFSRVLLFPGREGGHCKEHCRHHGGVHIFSIVTGVWSFFGDLPEHFHITESPGVFQHPSMNIALFFGG